MNGLKTSEFWLTVLVITCATALRVTGDLDAESWKWAVTGATAFYTASRAYVKAQSLDGDTKVERFRTDLEVLARTTATKVTAAKKA